MTEEKNKNTKSDPLKDLFVDGAEIDRELLAQLLEDYIGIDSRTLRPVFKEGYRLLGEKMKLIVYLLYKKALLLTEKITQEQEAEKPKEISKATGVNYNSARSYLSQLRTKGSVDMEEGGSYFIPGYSLSKIKEALKKKNENGK